MTGQPPVIVLVRPQLGQNIGKAARAMLNFGLTELRLVAPRDGWPNPEAGPAASGADVVLERAQLFDTTADAIADCGLVYASTVRRRDLVIPVVDPEEMAREIHSAAGRGHNPFQGWKMFVTTVSQGSRSVNPGLERTAPLGLGFTLPSDLRS